MKSGQLSKEQLLDRLKHLSLEDQLKALQVMDDALTQSKLSIDEGGSMIPTRPEKRKITYGQLRAIIRKRPDDFMAALRAGKLANLSLETQEVIRGELDKIKMELELTELQTRMRQQ